MSEQEPEEIWAVTEPNDVSADILGDVYAQQTPDGMVGKPVKYIRADLVTPRVKPLAWVVFDAWTMWAETSVGKYAINDIASNDESGCVLLKIDGKCQRYIDPIGDDWGMWPNIGEAKAAAQADYERRVLSALILPGGAGHS